MVAAGPRLPKPIGGDNGGDEPLRISLGEGMMGELCLRLRVGLCRRSSSPEVRFAGLESPWELPQLAAQQMLDRRQPEAVPRRLLEIFVGRSTAPQTPLLGCP